MCARLAFALMAAIALSSVTTAEEISEPGLSELRLLYVGSERPAAFEDFLAGHVGHVETADRESFQPSQANSFDVVILDWPQSEKTRGLRKTGSPLGARDEWHKPTVLVGSAGLNLAVAWQVQGGSGCTCMDPLAYRFREHAIFHHPFHIKLDAMVRIPTPMAFDEELEEEEIEVLPLVDDRDTKWRSGWCTYTTHFDRNPDVEVFCGGVNEKTPTAAGIWRQGNLLHFGFEQSPEEMNEHGRQLLLNCIAYIARFTEDRPIATTPSVFGGPIARPRGTPARWLSRESYKTEWVLEMFEPATREIIAGLADRDAQAQWCREHELFFYPAQDQLLGLDPDLQLLNVAFDTDDFFDRVLPGLDSPEADVAAACRRLLERYVPCGPGAAATPSAWREWYASHRAYLFALDTGDYRWYVDEVARGRQIPSAELRGTLRADRGADSDAGQ
jgi:hypothetical protein